MSLDRIILLNQLKKHEGFRQFVYKCSAGYLTIGYGRNLEHKGINEKEAEWLLKKDIEFFESKIKEKYKWYKDLDETRQCIIINMAFNIGIKGLSKFKNMIKAIKNKNWHIASNEMLDSKWAKQVGIRALELSNQMRSGLFQEEITN